MKRTSTFLLAGALFFSLTSEKCDKDNAAATTEAEAKPSTSNASMIGTRWNLATLAGEAIRLPEGVENPHITVQEGDRIAGFGGCNRIMGSVKIEGASISFPGLGGTKMYCEKSQALETAFMNALRAANSYTIEGETLTLLDKSKELATLVKK